MEKKMKFKLLFLISASLISSTVLASSEEDKFSKLLNDKIFPDAKVTVFRKAPVEELRDFYEINVGGQDLIMHNGGKIAISGNIIDVENRIDLTSAYKLQLQGRIAEEEIKKLSEDNFITFSPKGKKIGTAYIFTDTTCGYCKKLHFEMPEYLERGIEVKYIPYPRGGLVDGSLAYEQSKQMMCAEDKNSAIDELKKSSAGFKYVKDEYPENCVELVYKGISAGEKIGLRGTPFIYLSNGIAIPGYKPVSLLENLLK
jgi:thiol:disulfide interchange protein DsbC